MGKHGGGGRRGRPRGSLLVVAVASLVAFAAIGTGVARAWHADGVTVSASCDLDSSQWVINAEIQQSEEWPGAVVLSVKPSSLPGAFTGDHGVTVVIGWNDSEETQTFIEKVTLDGSCVTPPPVHTKGTLVVIKHVVNDNGGTASAGDWRMDVDGPSPRSFQGAEAPGVSHALLAGDYTVTESGGPSGYALSYSGDCDASGHVTVAVSETSTCILTNDDVAPAPPRHPGQGSISVSKSADPTSLKEPGGPVTFSVRITNTSNVDVTIQNVVDDKFGDLDDEGGSGCFDVPIKLGPGDHASCQFSEPITGPGGTQHVDTVTASGVDENGHAVSGSGSATVDITPKLIDLVITKQASSPTPLNGTVDYAMTVTNKGPDAATNVQLADPAPAGITYLTASASQGSCTVTAALITCDLGSIASGQTVTVGATGKSTSVGSHTNTATVTGSGGQETNPADNTASAVTVTPAPATPPTPKPHPKPHAKPCIAVAVTPRMIKADGKTDTVVVRVTAGGKAVAGAKVMLEGSGIHQSGRSNAKGIVTFTVNPAKAGILTISTPETRHACGSSRRIGVAGVFLPPVTG